MPAPQFQEPRFRVRSVGSRVVQKTRAPKNRKRKKRRLKRPDERPRWKKYLLRASITAGILGILGVIGIVAAFAWFSRDLPDPDKILERNVAQSTKIYARDGSSLLYEIHGDVQRTLIQIEDIPDHMKQATLAIEDQDFYQHQGFDLPGITKAICHEVFGNLGGLCPQRGGSTITQQFVKNAILTSERSYTRKIKELVLAYQIEKKFTKDQILQMYFNEIPFGSTLYGVESAAQSMLGKSVKDVTVSEAAFLAAIPQRPTYYSPYGNHTDELSRRLHIVLNEMVEMGFITADEAEEAKEDNILERLNPKYENIKAPHFVMYVREILAERYGEKLVEQGGLKVVTTLDIEKQRLAEEAIENRIEKNSSSYNASNAALVSIDARTGQVVAMVGSRDYFDETVDGNVNVAIRPRQPGSSFKPIAYLTAFQKGYTPDTILFDLNTVFKTDAADYAPKNYDLAERGPVSMRQALAGSLNIPAVKTLYLAGIDNVLDTAEALGYTTLQDRSRFGLSLVLGGGEVTLLEHTSAFATLAQEGVRHPVSTLLRVEDARGKILEEFENREARVLEKEDVQILNSVLSDDSARAYVFGPGSYLTLPGRPVAAKTGTTNDYRDAWTMGFTPSYATGVWVGNNDNSEMYRGAAGAVVAAPIWNEYMRNAITGDIEYFSSTPENTAEKPILQGELEGETKIFVDSVTGNIIPDICLEDYPEKFKEEKIFRVVHNILHYVQRDNPDGPVPDDPTTDPQYEAWEAPVRQWAADNNYVEQKPPNESCNLRSSENLPNVTITFPKKGTSLTKRSFTITSKVSSSRTIASVDFYFDGNKIGTLKKSPYQTSHTVNKNKKNGFYDIKVVATDDIGNTKTATVTINYRAGKNTPITNSNSNTNNTNQND